MIIHLDEILSQLESWRAKNNITVENQKKDYLINVMEELGEISNALRLLEKSERVNDSHELKCVKHFITNNICNIAILTINAGTDIPNRKIETTIDTNEVILNHFNLANLIIDCSSYYKYECINQYYFNCILRDCAKLCEYYGYNFEEEMLKVIKEISSLAGDYYEKVRKWAKDEIVKSSETELATRILRIENAVKNASSFDEFKSFCLEDYNETTRHIPKDSVTVEDNTPKEEPTMDRLAEFNLETYKEEAEADVNRAIRSLYCY